MRRRRPRRSRPCRIRFAKQREAAGDRLDHRDKDRKRGERKERIERSDDRVEEGKHGDREENDEGREHVVEEGRGGQCDEEKEDEKQPEHVPVNGPGWTGQRLRERSVMRS